jgi:uncharacterized membrane protein
MRLLGHPIHPMLVHFPIAFWSAGTATHRLSILGVHDAWPYAGLFLAIGSATAVIAMIAGLLDFAALDEKSARSGTRHMLLMTTSWAIYLAALLTRSDGWGLIAEPRPMSIALSFTGLMVMAAGGYFGAQLVYGFGAGAERIRPD